MAWKFKKSSFDYMAYYRSEISYIGVFCRRTGFSDTFSFKTDQEPRTAEKSINQVWLIFGRRTGY